MPPLLSTYILSHPGISHAVDRESDRIVSHRKALSSLRHGALSRSLRSSELLVAKL